MLVDMKEGRLPNLICEECSAVIPLAEDSTIYKVWLEHARACPEGCPAPPASATHLRLAPVTRG